MADDDTDVDIREMLHPHHDDEAITVKVQHEPVVQEAAADKSSWTTYQLKGDGSTPVGVRQRLLALLKQRHKAQIIVYGTAGDFIVIGRQEQAANGQGGRIYTNSGPIPVESASALYINAYTSVSANDIFVTVIEELYVR